MKVRTVFAIGIFFILGNVCGFAVDTIVLSEPTIFPKTQENERVVVDILKRAAVLSNRRFGEQFVVEYNPAGENPANNNHDFKITVSVSMNGQETATSLNMKRNQDDKSASFPVLGEFKDDKVGYLASVFASLWNSFSSWFEADPAGRPRFVEALPAEMLLASVPGLHATQVGMLPPVSGAVRSNGNLLVGFSSTALELDSSMRLIGVIGKDLMDAGNYTYAYGISVTPADTIYFKPGQGREVYRYIDGAPRTQRIRVGMDLFGGFVVLPDGSIVIKDVSSSKTVRIEGRKRYDLDLKTSASSYISLIAAGPEGNLWVWDQVERRIKVFSGTGELLDSILPILSADSFLAPQALVVYPDGSFITSGYGAAGMELRRFRRDGSSVWLLNEIDLPEPEPLPTSMAMAFDPTTGYLYIFDMMGKRILKLLDRIWAVEHQIDTTGANTAMEFNALLSENPGDTEVLRKMADYYQQIGAIELAKTQWSAVLDYDPFDGDAQDMLDSLEVITLKQQAKEMVRKTLSILETLGPESARLQYQTTIQIFERILFLDPSDEDSKGTMDRLKEAFLQQSTKPSGRAKPLTIAAVKMENLFPSLMLFYRNNAAGTVTVQNSLEESVTQLQASIFIRKYMDFATESELVGELAPGDEIVLDLILILNEQVLSLQEDLPVQARVEVSYLFGEEKQTVSKNMTVTLYRKTALSWDYSGRLASFIMPNEDVVSLFAHRVLHEVNQESQGLPAKLVRAAKLCDALGAYGIEYIEDPESPFSKILGKSEIVDTVRFPRTTLNIKSGDCDDTTALLGSLLESSGVKTAIMTSPGHVFLAFDTGEPSENLWLFQPEGYEVINHGGSIWIPVETTTLKQGFVHSWAVASGLIQKNPDHIEFLPVAGQRDSYPPLPLPSSSITIVEPQKDEVNILLLPSLSGARDVLYTSGLRNLQAQMDAASGRKQLKYRNRLGVLHARFGESDKARRAFEDNLAESESYLASYLNLANLLLNEEDTAQAIGLLEQGLTFKPDSASLNLLLARIHHSNRDFRDAWNYFGKVKDVSPELAERYSYLGGGESTVRRAGIEEDFPLMWDEGE